MNTDTIKYYNEHTDEYVNSTVNVDFNETQNTFLNLIPKGGRILDFGCGSGRDTKCFLEQGFLVDACDGSEELCKYASDYTGIKVKNMLFSDLDEVSIYDGIWACASILHLAKDELKDVFVKMIRALKNGGVIYASFKYGDFEGVKNGRYFTYLDDASLQDLIVSFDNLEVERSWVTTDVRPHREEEKWLNILMRKN